MTAPVAADGARHRIRLGRVGALVVWTSTRYSRRHPEARHYLCAPAVPHRLEATAEAEWCGRATSQRKIEDRSLNWCTSVLLFPLGFMGWRQSVNQIINQIVQFLQQGIAAIFKFFQLIWTWSFGQMVVDLSVGLAEPADLEDRGPGRRLHRYRLRALQGRAAALGGCGKDPQGLHRAARRYSAILPYHAHRRAHRSCRRLGYPERATSDAWIERRATSPRRGQPSQVRHEQEAERRPRAPPSPHRRAADSCCPAGPSWPCPTDCPRRAWPSACSSFRRCCCRADLMRLARQAGLVRVVAFGMLVVPPPLLPG